MSQRVVCRACFNVFDAVERALDRVGRCCRAPVDDRAELIVLEARRGGADLDTAAARARAWIAGGRWWGELRAELGVSEERLVELVGSRRSAKRSAA